MIMEVENGEGTLPETNSSPLKIGLPNRKAAFQPFREGNYYWTYTNFSLNHDNGMGGRGLPLKNGALEMTFLFGARGAHFHLGETMEEDFFAYEPTKLHAWKKNPPFHISIKFQSYTVLQGSGNAMK